MCDTLYSHYSAFVNSSICHQSHQAAQGQVSASSVISPGSSVELSGSNFLGISFDFLSNLLSMSFWDCYPFPPEQQQQISRVSPPLTFSTFLKQKGQLWRHRVFELVRGQDLHGPNK
jgi:hypothetical protein